MTLLSSALVMVGVVAELNRENAWYANLGELFGASPTAQDDAVDQPATTTTGTTVARQAIGSAALPPLPSPGQRLQRYHVGGPSGITNGVVVLLPEGCSDPASAARRYPVLVLGHGMPGHNRQWLSSIDIRTHLDPLVAARRVGPAVVVLPEMQAPGGVDT